MVSTENQAKMHSQNEKQINSHRISGLDGIRAMAVLMVICAHTGIAEGGWVGVQIFFVLSGFLITRSLIKEKTLPLPQYLRRFYGRRSLRIFPLYYGFLLATAALYLAFRLNIIGKSAVPFFYASTYTYNFYMASKSSITSGFLLPLWSLSVEEQFYLLWPLFVYLLNGTKLRRALIAIVLAGPFIRLACWLIMPRVFKNLNLQTFIYVLPFSHLDAFAVGALLSVVKISASRISFLATLLVTLTVGFLVNGPHASPFPPGLPISMQFVWGYSLINLTAAMLISSVRSGNLFPGFFNGRLLSYLGSISYGIYIFHLPVITVIGSVWLPEPGILRILQRCFCVLITVVIAGLSFKFFESPITNLKYRFFPSQMDDASNVTSSAVFGRVAD